MYFHSIDSCSKFHDTALMYFTINMAFFHFLHMYGVPVLWENYPLFPHYQKPSSQYLHLIQYHLYQTMLNHQKLCAHSNVENKMKHFANDPRETNDGQDAYKSFLSINSKIHLIAHIGGM